MAATYVQDKERFINLSAQTSISVTLNAAPTANNLLVAHVHVRLGASISAITASGWSGASFENVSGEASAVLYKVSDGTETTTTFSFTGGSGGEPAAIVTEFSGLDSIAPFDGASSVASGSASSLTPSDVTPSSAPGLAHGGVSCSVESSWRTLYTPAGYTSIEIAGSGLYNPLIRTAYKTYADTTAVSITGTASGATELAVHLALFKEPTAGYTHPTLSAATLVPAGGNTYQPRVSYSFP